MRGVSESFVGPITGSLLEINHVSLSWLFKRRQRVSFAEFKHEVRQFRLAKEGLVEYAQWLHPYETPKVMTQEAVDAVRCYVEPGDFVIDIGAHTGDTTVPMALAVGPTGCTLALEPNPFVFKVLAKNASLNFDKTNIVPQCYAATEREGRFVFHYSDAAFCNGGFKSQQRWRLFRRRYPLSVEGRNLERVLRTQFADWLPKLSYVKVDAEGYDRAILASILPLLKKCRPVIRTEVFRKLMASERYALYDLLASMGYRIHRFEEGAQPQGESLARDAVTQSKHFDVLAVPQDRLGQVAA